MIPYEDALRKVADTDIDGVAVYRSEIIFTHVDGEGLTRHFAVERMAKAAEQRGLPIHPIAVDHEMWEMIRNNNGIEDHRLYRLDAQACLRPTLWVELPERPSAGAHATAILVDGSHRLVYAYGMLKWNRIPGHIFPVGTWEEFLVDIPKELSEWDAKRIRAQCNGGPGFFSGIR